MTTKAQLIKELKAEYPTLKTGDDETGYVEMEATEYEATIQSWAENKLADLAKVLEFENKETAKAELLTKLGITADEAALLLS
jgi:acetamidase/formamidase